MRSLFYWIMLAGLLSSCNKDSQDIEMPAAPAVLLLNGHSFEIPEEGGRFSVEVACTFDYEVSIPTACRSWLRETDGSATSSKAVHHFVIHTNSDFRERTGYVVFGNSTVRDTAYVIQTAKKSVLGLDKCFFEMPEEGGDFQVEVNSNMDYKVTIPDSCRSWLSEAKKTDDQNVHRFAVATNETCHPRAGIIIFGNDKLSDTVRIAQHPMKASVLQLSTRRIKTLQPGDHFSVTAISNIEYEVTIPDEYSSWLNEESRSMAASVYTYNFAVTENESFQIREGMIIFGNDKLKDTVLVAQEELAFMQNRRYDLPKEGGVLSFSGYHDFGSHGINNYGYGFYNRYGFKQTWSGAERSQTMHFFESEFYEEFQIPVTMWYDKPDNCTGHEDTVWVIKAGKPKLVATNSNAGSERDTLSAYRPGIIGSYLYVKVVSEVDEKVIIPAEFSSWIIENGSEVIYPQKWRTKGTQYAFDIAVNKTDHMRKGYVIFSDGELSDTVHVIQKGAPPILVARGGGNFSSYAKIFSVDVASNRDNYTITIPEECRSWIFAPPGDASENPQDVFYPHRHTFAMTENPTISERKGMIVFSAGEFKDTVHITQAGAWPILRLLYSGVRNIKSEGGDFSITVESNFDYAVTIPEECKSWISEKPQDVSNPHRHTFTIAANTTLQKRKGYIQFGQDEIKTAKVSVDQEAAQLVWGENFTEKIAPGVEFDMVFVEHQRGFSAKSWTYSCGSVYTTLREDYYIGKHEVTQKLWLAVMGESSTWEWKYGAGDDYPVYNISQEEAVEFCRRLSRITGRKYALPNGAQFVFALKGGGKSQGYKYSGSDDPDEVSWFRHNNYDDVFVHPVGTKKPNELGIYDMGGNVNEWSDDIVFYSSNSTDYCIYYDRGGSVWNYANAVEAYDNGGRMNGSHIVDSKPAARNKENGLRIVLIP